MTQIMYISKELAKTMVASRKPKAVVTPEPAAPVDHWESLRAEIKRSQKR